MYKLYAKKLFTGEEILEDRVILFDENKIYHIGDDINESAKETYTANFVMPPIIDLGSGIGLKEESLGKIEGDDLDEATNPVTPELLTLDGINPYDEAFEKAIRGGTLISLVLPGNANPIGGRGALIYNKGKHVLDMLIQNPLGVKFSINSEPKSIYGSKNKTPSTRMGIAYVIRDTLYKAIEYKNEHKELNLAYEALQDLISQNDLAIFASFRADDIATSLRIAKEFNLKSAILYGIQSNLVKNLIKENNVPVIYGPVMFPRWSIELKGLSPNVPIELINEGILTALTTGHPMFPSKYLRLNAGLLVKEGLNEVDALKTITLNPAKIIGKENLGTLRAEGIPNIVAFDNSPYDTNAITTHIFLKGVRII
ncbi:MULTISPECIES: amidohydrolase [Caldisericum]|jgi:imidazolonepropionase-like amidohydrolase|uniref:amidohydrolase n=1 Tax=Caldisericum TaxID=693074 RepID=UPI0039FBA26B